MKNAMIGGGPILRCEAGEGDPAGVEDAQFKRRAFCTPPQSLRDSSPAARWSIKS